MTRTARRLGARLGLTVAALALAIAGAAMVSPDDGGIAVAGDPLGAGGEFHPITPIRVLDSRDPNNDTAPLGRKPSDSVSDSVPFEVDVLGRGDMPAFLDGPDEDGYDDNVLAVVVSIIVVRSTGTGHLRAYPSGATEGNTSVINFQPDSIVPNSAVLRPGIDGKISLRLVTPAGPGDADVVVDVSGWFSTSSPANERGSRLIPIPPMRVYDSGLAQFGAALVGPEQQVEVPIWGAVDANAPGVPVPDDDKIVAVVVNVTGENRYPGALRTHLAALPAALLEGTRPPTSTVNLAPGQVRANLAILPVGVDGSIHVYNRQGELRVVVDIMGYFVEDQPVETVDGRVIPLTAPFRVFDSRGAEFGALPLGPGRAEDWSFDGFVADVNIGGEPVGDQSGLLGNLTATNLQRQYVGVPVRSFMSAYPSPGSPGGDPPEISNLNIAEGVNVPNMALLRYGGDAEDPHQVRFYNRAGYIHYLLDVYAVVLTSPSP